MTITKFIKGIEEEFEDLKPGFLKPESNLKENFNWDSINALIFIAHVSVEYNAEINAQELIQAVTVQDLFNMVESKALKANKLQI
jgi:acyl carrier protein